MANGAWSTNVSAGSHRFYEQVYPDAEDLVMVKVKRIADMGAYASLLEYNNLEGMILMSELSKRRFRSVNKLIKVGKKEVVMVMRVDKEKGYIDLSKKRVSHEDIQICENRYSKSRKVYQTVRHVAEKHNMSVEELNLKVVWPLYKRYGHALDALREAAVDPEEVFTSIDISDEMKKYLLEDIRLRLSPQALKLQAPIHLACYGYSGIDAVKFALLAAKKLGDGKTELKVKLIAAPLFVVVTSCYDKEKGIALIESALKAVETTIKEFKGGEYKLQGAIQVIGGEDEKRLEELLAQKEKSSSEESSCEEEEEDEGMGRVCEEDEQQFLLPQSNISDNEGGDKSDQGEAKPKPEAK